MSDNILFQRLAWFGIVGLFLATGITGYLAWRKSSQAYVIIEWETASELNTAGFILNRSEMLDGPYERVNSQLIPASLDPLTGGSYAYKDLNVKPSVTYYYELQDVELDGNISTYGPIEVTAITGGRQESILSLMFFVAGGIGLMYFLRLRKQVYDRA